MRLATWNVNSIRARVDRVVDWVKGHDVDVLAMQETKCKDEQFPFAAFEDLGYQVAHLGFSQWNGVAIASRVGLDDVRHGFAGMPSWGDPPVAEARAIGALVGTELSGAGPIRLWSLYIPNGRELGDPHLQYKLDWLERLRLVGQQWLSDDPDAPIALVGDWNIAPQDDDVWSTEFYADKTHVSAPERAAFRGVVEAGFADVVRPFAPGPGVYTYWDYTQLRFPKRQGMRIDFILGSAALAGRVSTAMIDREARKGKGASDHAPVVITLD